MPQKKQNKSQQVKKNNKKRYNRIGLMRKLKRSTQE